MVKTGTDLKRAVEILCDGGLVAIPTETVYGLAANAFDAKAVTSVFEVKKRPRFDPLIVHVKAADELNNIVGDFPGSARKLAQKFWPGPLTLVLPKNKVVPDLVTSGLSTVAVRIPNHPLTLELLRQLPFPLVAPSANPFGYVSPTHPAHVARHLGSGIDYILDGGPCEVGIESTIIGYRNGDPHVLRLGGLDLQSIENVIGNVDVPRPGTSDPIAPGMLESHYSPEKEILILESSIRLELLRGRRIGLLRFSKSHGPEVTLDGLNIVLEMELSDHADTGQAARNLFSTLRKLDESDIDLILAEPAPEKGLGLAINDRLRRASVPAGRK